MSTAKETSTRRKRAAEEDLTSGVLKAVRLSTVEQTASTSVPSKITMTYPNGGIRITRTPGRQHVKNCVNLGDLVHKEHLVSAFVFSFFIADDEFFPYFPLSHSSDTVPIFIGRDANMDSTVQAAFVEAGISMKGKVSNKQLQDLVPRLREINHEQYGKNFHSFYAWSPGSSHSKILVLVYPEFLRIVITSCNMMNIDVVLGDNHWYIHDLPRRPTPRKGEPTGFEADFLSHLHALGTPETFLESIRGIYDYTTVKVDLVTSVPGVCAGPKAEKHGLLRLRRVVQEQKLSLPAKKSEGKLRLEVCAASIGNLSAKWLDGFYDCALGEENISCTRDTYGVPDMELFYPTVEDVKSSLPSAQDAASNIGCHTRPWDAAANEIKHMFHHYESKDRGRLFHQKLIMAYDARDDARAEQPYYVYLGSANLSPSAWGALEQDKSKLKNKQTCETKLVKMSNFECGVMVPGHLIQGLLEPGTKSWRDGIVPYVQSAKRYDLSVDRPWNDPRWVQGRE